MGLTLGRVRGIRIAVDPSWFIILIVMTLSLYIYYGREFLATPHGYLLLAAIVSSAVFFACVLLHELSHSLLAQTRGVSVEGIVLFVFGGVSRLRSEPTRPKDEMLIASIGPVTSLVLGGLFLLARLVVPPPYALARSALNWLGTVNLLLAAFNLLPAFPLDGGRVFRASVWLLSGSLKRATRVAVRVSAMLAYALMGFGAIIMLFSYAMLTGLWMAFIGWFLLTAAQTSLRDMELRDALGRRRVYQVMRPAGPPVPPTETVEMFVERRVLGAGERGAFVAGDGVAGWVSLEEIKKLDRDKWEDTPLQEIMIPLSEVASVKRSDPLFSAFEKMNARAVDQLPVVEDGELLGVVTRDDVLRAAAVDLELRDTRET